MRKASSEHDVIVARMRADTVSHHSRSWTTMARPLGLHLAAVLSLESTRRPRAKPSRWRVDASFQDCTQTARAPRHDAPTTRTWSGGHVAALTTLRLDHLQLLRAFKVADGRV